VSILPQVTFVERIGGERVQVQALVKPGESPATYDPGARQLADLYEADVFFRIGVPFENAFLPRLRSVVPDLPVVDTRRGIALRRMKGHHHHGEDEHDAARHDHADGDDPHTWLNPIMAAQQVRTMTDTLAGLDPQGAAYYRANSEAFIRELEQLDARLARQLEPVAGRTMMVFHPSWGYFADRYGLEQEAIEMEGKEPGARQLARLMEHAREENVSVIFVQPQFSRASAAAVAQAIKGRVVVIDALAEDYINNLEEVARRIRDGLEESVP
jgi:zinc transport system substrate-binding protein